MPSLSSSISLALAAKLRLLFEKDADKFLSFPIGLAYPTSFFSFMQANGGLSAVDQENFKLEFARVANMLPKDAAAFPQDTDTLLWDVYARSLEESVFADSTLTSGQNAQLDQAIDFLMDKQTVEGIEVTVPSAVVQAYYQYKTLYDNINRQYLDEKLTVDFAENDDEGRRLRETWQTIGEKDWLDQLKRAEDDWVNLGQRDTVKQFQAVQADLGPKRFPLRFKTACQNDLALGELPDLNANGIVGGYVTFFSPNNVFQHGTPWLSLTLSKAEVKSLAAQAPTELSARFGSGQADDTIESLSFEYNKVVLVRPWLNVNFFSARCWKLPGNAVLSDGHRPRSGQLPAFTSSLIVVRNIRVTRLQTATQVKPLVIPILSKLQMSKFVVSRQIQPVVAKKNPHVSLPAATLHVARPFVRLNMAGDPPGTSDAGATLMTRLPVQKLQMQKTVFLRSTINVAQPVRVMRPIVVQPVSGTGTRPEPVPRPKTVEEKFDFDGVVIIAFECTRLPKSPDPDLSLPWT